MLSQAPTGASGLLRVTVSSGTRRVDLALPGAVPVAELVPELARCVGLLDAVTVYGGYRLVTQDGRALATDSGLAIQGVRDGGIITLAAGVDDEPPRTYEDVVEAMNDVVERDLERWDAAAGRRTALWAAVLFLLVGGASLLLQQGSGNAAGAVAALLVLGAGALSHTQGETQTHAAVAVALPGLRLRRRGRSHARGRPTARRHSGRGGGRQHPRLGTGRRPRSRHLALVPRPLSL